MTDKQIIIDGVDVSGCENYGETMAKTHNCTLYDEYLRPCKGTDCYYKQLKRKEQECEAYQKQFKADTKEMEDYQNTIVRHLESIEYWVQQFKAKEQECEQLKNLLEGVQKSLEVEIEECSKWSQLETEARFELVKTQQQLDQLKAENEELKGVVDENFLHALEEQDGADKYFKTLTEIKEIAENGCYDDCGMPLDELSIILQKISECEGNDE